MVLKVLYAAVQTMQPLCTQFCNPIPSSAVTAWMGWKVQASCDCTSGHIELPVDCRRRRGLPRGPLGSATRIAYAALMPLSIEVEGDVDNLP